MNWFTQLFVGQSAAQSVVVLALTIVFGLALGLLHFRGIRLGVGGVLFSGLALGHFGLRLEPHVLTFVREFGLILFVFSIGMQVGPGFVDSLRRRGLVLNLMAALIVVLGVAVTVVCSIVFDLPLSVAVGLFSGAVTNTPALAAASQAFSELGGTAEQVAAAISEAGLGYAVAYPFGILGIILVMLLVRAVFRINTAEELRAIEEQDKGRLSPLHNMTVRVANPSLFGKTLAALSGIGGDAFVISRLREPGENGRIFPASPEVTLSEGMLVHAVGDDAGLKRLQILVGPDTGLNLSEQPGPLDIRSLRVTRGEATGKSLSELKLRARYGVTITRVVRSGMEFSPRPDLHLHFADKLTAVGKKEGLDGAEQLLGNSPRALSQPHVLPIFVGILLGTILGSLPVAFPGLPSGVKLGLAGGPLLVAIILSRMHHFAGMIWYMPTSANLILREVGIVLFLACVGLHAGGGFLAALTGGSGFAWMGIGALITFVPLLTVALVGRLFLGCNYTSLCGLLAGSMTDPPALAFASQMLGSDVPASVYASVYPLTMILRILMGQLLVLGLYAL